MANNNKHTGPNIPALRFPEFSGEWEKYRVSDILEFYPTNSLSWDQLEYDGGECLNLHYGLIHNGLPVQVNLSKDSLPSIKADFFPKRYTFCQDGDIAFADASEDTNDVGKAIEFYYCAGKEAVCGLHTIHGRDKLGITVPGFKGYVFSSKVFHDQIKTIAQGTKVFSIKASNFDEVVLGIPSKEEQKKISRLLMAIDERITTQSKIIEEQETLLNSLADSLISSQLANMALNDCVVARSSAMKESELENSGPFPVFGASGLCGYSNEALEESDSILVTKDGSGVGTCQYATGAHAFLGTLCSLTAKEGVYLPYVYYALLNFNFASFKTGLAIPHIYFKDYGKAVIYCPSYDEQVRIASGLEKIEAKIKSDTELLKQYELQKEYLLSRMFI